MSDRILNVNDSNFHETIDANEYVLVDFWAEWCGPCKMIAPILEEIADEYHERVQVVKVNIDQNPETPSKFGIRGIPTLLLFKNGDVHATKVGALTSNQLKDFLETNL